MMTVAKRLGLAAMTAPIAGLHWHKPQSKILIVGAQRQRRAFSPLSPNSPVICSGWMDGFGHVCRDFAVRCWTDCLGGPALQCKIEPDTSDIHPHSLEVCLDDRTDRDTYFHWRVFRRFCLNSRKSRRRHQHFVTGYQWYWTYEYTDEDVFFESYMIGANGGYLNAGIIAQLRRSRLFEDEFALRLTPLSLCQWARLL
jgi:cytochrome c oxidase subunit 2